ncbi:MAG: hypothetical protein ACRDV9_14450, partial [Acidimicrobiia bacterium]
MAFTLLAASLVTGVIPASAHHEPEVRDNPWTYRAPHAGVVAPTRAPGRLAPARGALLGVHPEGSHTADLTVDKQKILETEAVAGRRMDINNDYYGFFDIVDNWKPEKVVKPFDAADETTWDGRGLSRLAYWDVSLGRVPLVGWACQNSANINSGQYDEVIRTTGLAFQALGAEFFMRYCWEMDGSKRIKDESDDDGDGNRSEPHVGAPEDFIRAWNRIYDIIAAPLVPMVHEVPLTVARVGAKNVIWVWCGNAAFFKDTNDAGHYAWDYYPGDAVVDWVSADGYNWALSKRNRNANPPYSKDRWRGMVEIFDEFMVWARWTPASGPVPDGMRFENNGDLTGVPAAFPRKGAVRPIMIGEYGAIEKGGTGPDDGRAKHYTDIADNLTKPQWIIDAHDTVNGFKATTPQCHWCGIYSDIAAMVYFDINADKEDQNGDWRIASSQASIDAYNSAAADDPWFKQIGNIGWPQAVNSNYESTPPPVTPPTPPLPPVGPPPPVPPDQLPGARSGYWMVGSDGTVYAFGDAEALGNAPVGSARAVD